MPLSFAVTWDYRCPFARNVHDHLVDALLAGADWEVRFVPFSLSQVHVTDAEPDIWDRPQDDSGLLALQAGVYVRDHHPELFLRVHRDLFDARHVQGRRLQDREVVAEVLDNAGLDSGRVLAAIDEGSVLPTVRKEHESAADQFDVWGVPTFIVGDRAAFVRLTTDAGGDPELARRTIERIVALVGGWPELNELKHTTLDR